MTAVAHEVFRVDQTHETARRSDPTARAAARRDDPTYQAYLVLWIGFTVAPLAFGLDKFLGLLTNWEQYLAPWIAALAPVDASTLMRTVGVVEIVAGIVVALRPRWGGYLVAAWLAGIIVDLLTYSGYYDIALRDFGLLLGAVALARLAARFDARDRRVSDRSAG